MKMLNYVFENNGMNLTGAPCEGLSTARCSLLQDLGPGCHHVTARVKWNKEVNKTVMECSMEVSLQIRKENLSGETERECLQNGEKREYLNQQSNMYVIRQGQSETMVGYQNLNWKQQKDKYKMNPRVNFVESKM